VEQLLHLRVLKRLILPQGILSEFLLGFDMSCLVRTSGALTASSLIFFCMNKGKIVSSLQSEKYTTFEEKLGRAPGKNSDFTSDVWLASKLQEHYYRINRRQQTTFGDLISMKTMGFATFIRVCIF
jgi:hypothetical protein